MPSFIAPQRSVRLCVSLCVRLNDLHQVAVDHPGRWLDRDLPVPWHGVSGPGKSMDPGGAELLDIICVTFSFL